MDMLDVLGEDEWERIALYEVYAMDATPNKRPEAETMDEQDLLKAQKNAPI